MRKPIIAALMALLAIFPMMLIQLREGHSAESTTMATPDAFYDPPSRVPSKPGVLLRSEPLKQAVLPKDARAWRILYTTTLDDNIPAIASATVLAPTKLSVSRRPVITWTHGTVGIVPKCGPSLYPVPYSGVPALEQIVAQGWVLVATDYTGQGTKGLNPYIIGEGEARNALDSVRAARQMPELTLEDRTVVWGHSQGGHAALWTGILAPRYAPDVKVIGVAAIAPASNMAAVLEQHHKHPRGALYESYVATAYSQFYPDVKFNTIVRPEAHLIARKIAGLCRVGPDSRTIKKTLKQLDGPVLAVDLLPVSEAFGERLQENTPDDLIAAPLMIIQGKADKAIDPRIQDRFIRGRCAAGQNLEYWLYDGQEHGTLVEADSPLNTDLVHWTQARLAGIPQASGCRTVER